MFHHLDDISQLMSSTWFSADVVLGVPSICLKACKTGTTWYISHLHLSQCFSLCLLYSSTLFLLLLHIQRLLVFSTPAFFSTVEHQRSRAPPVFRVSLNLSFLVIQLGETHENSLYRSFFTSLSSSMQHEQTSADGSSLA